MARHISVASVIEKNRIASEYAYVALMEVDVIDESTGAVTETLFLARNSEDVAFQGSTYRAASFEFEMTYAANEVPEIVVRARDITRTIQNRMEQHSGGVGFKVRVLIANTGNLAQPAEFEEQFYVLAAKVNGYTIEWQLGARNPLRIRFPRRLQFRDRCAWLFKSDECGYDGAETFCDYTLQGTQGCAVKNNTHRYGGFPGLQPRNVSR